MEPIVFGSANNLLESSRRPVSPLGATQPFGRAVYAQVFILGGGRSAYRWDARPTAFQSAMS